MRSVFATSVILILAVGCGESETGRVPVKGTVTYHGEPVEWGSISFRPTRDTKGPAAGTDIVDGKFEIPASVGPAAGAYTAHITIVEESVTQVISPKNPKRDGGMKSLEVPVQITPEGVEYEFNLPTPSDGASEIH